MFALEDDGAKKSILWDIGTLLVGMVAGGFLTFVLLANVYGDRIRECDCQPSEAVEASQ